MAILVAEKYRTAIDSVALRTWIASSLADSLLATTVRNKECGRALEPEQLPQPDNRTNCTNDINAIDNKVRIENFSTSVLSQVLSYVNEKKHQDEKMHDRQPQSHRVGIGTRPHPSKQAKIMMHFVFRRTEEEQDRRPTPSCQHRKIREYPFANNYDNQADVKPHHHRNSHGNADASPDLTRKIRQGDKHMNHDNIKYQYCHNAKAFARSYGITGATARGEIQNSSIETASAYSLRGATLRPMRQPRPGCAVAGPGG